MPRLVVVALIAAMTAAVAGAHPPTAAVARPLVRVDCPFAAPGASAARTECWRLRVPERRAPRAGRTLELLVVRFRSRAARPQPDPVLWLAGGPGGSAVALTTRPLLYPVTVEPLLARRDVIVLEQRGNRYSRPALTCRETERDVSCLKRLSAEGNDLRAYTSVASAHDIEALRRALRIERWNVLGESYGTRVAQTLIREHPAHLRSVVLDSVISIPDDTVADSSAEATGAFERLFVACSADAGCAAAYPDLEATLRGAFERLEQQPLRLRGKVYGVDYDVRLDGSQLLTWTYDGLFETSLIPMLPRAIAAAREGRLDPVWRAVAENFEVAIPQLLARGVHRAVYCNEEVPFTSPERVAAVDAANPGLAWLFSGGWLVDLCRALPAAHPDSVENRPVRSAVPTLLLTGQLDPVTPPAEGRRASRTLSRRFFFEFPGLGHWVNPAHPCPRRIMLAFLDDPTRRPDARCLREMGPPAWKLG